MHFSRARNRAAAALFVVASAFAALSVSSLWSGCSECSVDADCDDGVFCNGEELCVASACAAGPPTVCDDEDACTEDRCDADLDSCVFEAPSGGDRDGDGHRSLECGGGDCDDERPETYPGAPELCDGLDNDCDGFVAEDRDGDGAFDVAFCSEGTDCDDDDPDIGPHAVEVCNGIDDDCDGEIDENGDGDGDGWVGADCGGEDCDDSEPTTYPGAPELCDGLDNDCDGEADEDFDCVLGEWSDCWTACGTMGSFLCRPGCAFPQNLDECVPPTETCDNHRDDDCDGEVDCDDRDCAADPACA